MENKKTKNIGSKNGKILVFGGVYSNFQALEQMKRIAKKLNIPSENIICTGDVVGYCAEPEACVQSILDWKIHCIAGNVEIQLRNGEEDCGCNFETGTRCNIFSRQWYPFAQEKLSQKSIDWMKTLPDFIEFNLGKKKVFVLHGSFHKTAEYIFESTNWEIKNKNFKATNANVILAGHCGLPFHQIKENKYWLNSGVIGMPANDGTTRVWYMILDFSENENFTFKHQAFQYENEKAADLMQKHHLPAEYALTLKTGIWDNTEILPEIETNLSGKKIKFKA